MKALIWLSGVVKKPILRLTRDDYEDNALLRLVIVRGEGNHEQCNLWGFKAL